MVRNKIKFSGDLIPCDQKVVGSLDKCNYVDTMMKFYNCTLVNEYSELPKPELKKQQESIISIKHLVQKVISEETEFSHVNNYMSALFEYVDFFVEKMMYEIYAYERVINSLHSDIPDFTIDTSHAKHKFSVFCECIFDPIEYKCLKKIMDVLISRFSAAKYCRLIDYSKINNAIDLWIYEYSLADMSNMFNFMRVFGNIDKLLTISDSRCKRYFVKHVMDINDIISAQRDSITETVNSLREYKAIFEAISCN